MLVSGQVSAFGQPYGPYLQTDAEPDTQVDDQPRSPFLVSICQKEGYIVKVKLNPLVFLSIIIPVYTFCLVLKFKYSHQLYNEQLLLFLYCYRYPYL